MNWKAWLYSLVAGAVGGFASAGLSALAMPDAFNFTPTGQQHILKAMLIGVLVPVFTFLKQSPLPPTQVTTQTVTLTKTTEAPAPEKP